MKTKETESKIQFHCPFITIFQIRNLKLETFILHTKFCYKGSSHLTWCVGVIVLEFQRRFCFSRPSVPLQEENLFFRLLLSLKSWRKQRNRYSYVNIDSSYCISLDGKVSGKMQIAVTVVLNETSRPISDRKTHEVYGD